MLPRLVLALVLCAFAPNLLACAGDGRTGYPAVWWQAVPRDQLKSWEIAPQDAGPCEVILSKRGPLGILSNFAPTPIEMDGKRYESLEGFWQMMKFPEGPGDQRATIPGFTWTLTRDQVGQLVAFEAKHAGDIGSDAMTKLGINWVTYQGRQLTYRTPEKGDHYKVILAAMWAKVKQHPEVKEILLATKDLVLKADHHPEPDQPPAWDYFKIYMAIRLELQTGAAH